MILGIYARNNIDLMTSQFKTFISIYRFGFDMF